MTPSQRIADSAMRWRYRLMCWFFDRPDALNRRATVESELWAHAKAGTSPSPEECRDLALRLGVPRWPRR